MEITALWMVVVAIVLLYAIHLGRGVKLSVRLPGTGASLEVSDGRHAERIESLSPGPTGPDGDATDSAPKAE
jgi:hypothetical protein